MLYFALHTHITTPYNTDPQFHECLKTYLKTGEIESEPPTPPTNIEVQLIESDAKQLPRFTFTGMKDNTSVVHTNIYKNGKLYDYIVPAAKVGGNATQNVWTDYNFTDNNAIYEIECVDVCGNVSDQCSFSLDWNALKETGSLSITPSDAIDWNWTSLDLLSYSVTDSGVRINGCDKNAVHIVIPDEIEENPSQSLIGMPLNGVKNWNLLSFRKLSHISADLHLHIVFHWNRSICRNHSIPLNSMLFMTAQI